MPNDHPPAHHAGVRATVFADLRRRNERAAQVAQMLAGKRKRQIEQAIRARRQQRIHQAR